jgi:rod shape-determining protein MreC
MAQPARPRPGFSRRAQYGLFAGYVIAVVGVVVSLLLALTARFDPAGHAAIQSFFADLTAPVASVGRSIYETASAGVDGVAAYIDAGSKNRALDAELRKTKAELVEARAAAREAARLKALAGLVETRRETITAARLIASTGASSRRYATLAAGSLQNVANGQPVRSSDGLIGRIVAVGRVTARVLLITDGGNVVPVKRLSDGLPALATGRGDGGLDIRALEFGGNPFKLGDVFVTSGAGGIYPPDMPVAVARVRNRDFVIGMPLADPGRFDFATVEPPYARPAPDLPPAAGAE